MTYLFSETGRARLRAFVDRSTLFAFDLDGTLAPLVADPTQINIPSDIRERLISLNRVAPVAIITGRGRADAERHLGFNPGFLAGNHGAEGLPGREEQEAEFYRLGRQWRASLEKLLPDFAGSGIFLEDKGTTLSLHYRQAVDPDAAREEIVRAIMRLEPLPRRVGGKYVENVVPGDAPHKGEALLKIMEQAGCRRALYVGDDVTDEDVFGLQDDRIFGIRVGCEASSGADYCLPDVKEMAVLLDEIMELSCLES